MTVRCIAALMAIAGIGVAGCGGTSHARVRCRRSVRSAHTSTTTAWFPAPGEPGCRYPLIVFSPGSRLRPTNYVPLLTHLASAGFVVVGVQHQNRFGEVTDVLAHLPAIAEQLAPGLPAEIDTSRIGIAGHSLGAFIASHEAATDPRIDAALVMAGPLRPGEAPATRVPVLAIAGGADTAVPARLVRAYYDRVPAGVPHGYLQIAGATHGAYGNHCARQRTCDIVQSYATSFFRRYLDGVRSAGRLLDPRTPRSRRVALQTVGMP